MTTLTSRIAEREQERKAAREVWLCGGIYRPWRIASWTETFGEFDNLQDAKEFLRLLILGNPEKYEEKS